jgi:glycosyltransferase involved in cell wall biosynthesis
MKILQLPTEIAGQAGLTAKGLREIGHYARHATRNVPFGYPADISTSFSTWFRVSNPLLMFKWLEKFDIFHYHKSPYWRNGKDLSWVRKCGKKFIVEFWGSDIRLHALEYKRNPYFSGDNSRGDQKKLRRLLMWSEHTDQVVMSDHWADEILKPYFSKIHYVNQRIDTERYKPVFPDPENSRPLVLHAPSQMGVKGTEFIELAVEQLHARGLKFDYQRITGLTHAEAMRAYSRADIIVDQLLLGSHGVFACEAMALGKPVICYIREELVETYPSDLPIINANPDTICDVLEELIVLSDSRARIGREGRSYVERVHDIRQVARRLEKVYEQL